jgi:hypothetical protein
LLFPFGLYTPSLFLALSFSTFFFFSTPSYCYLSQPKLSSFQLSLSLDLNSLSFSTFFLVLFLPLSQHLATTWCSTHTLLSQLACYCFFWEVDSPLFFNPLSLDPPFSTTACSCLSFSTPSLSTLLSQQLLVHASLSQPRH